MILHLEDHTRGISISGRHLLLEARVPRRLQKDKQNLETATHGLLFP